jgi:tetrahydrodipicolinate N-acetyltransferase
VHISNSAHIQSGAPIIIGDYANIAAGTRIYAASNTYKTPDCREKQILLSLSTCAPSEMQYVKREPIVIEDYAFIGLNCIILPGIKIGRGAIVGAGTIITKDVKPYTIVYNALSRMEFERPYIP